MNLSEKKSYIDPALDTASEIGDNVFDESIEELQQSVNPYVWTNNLMQYFSDRTIENDENLRNLNNNKPSILRDGTILYEVTRFETTVGDESNYSHHYYVNQKDLPRKTDEELSGYLDYIDSERVCSSRNIELYYLDIEFIEDMSGKELSKTERDVIERFGKWDSSSLRDRGLIEELSSLYEQRGYKIGGRKIYEYDIYDDNGNHISTESRIFPVFVTP